MYGAILGDMIGSPYEFDQGNKSKEFPLFTGESHFTDDTVMTIAVAEALMKTAGDTRMQDMEHDLQAGCSRSIRCLMEATAMVRRCVSLQRDG